MDVKVESIGHRVEKLCTYVCMYHFPKFCKEERGWTPPFGTSQLVIATLHGTALGRYYIGLARRTEGHLSLLEGHIDLAQDSPSP